MTYVSGEGLEGVHHVEAVEVNNAGGHGLVAEAHLVAHLQDEASTLPPVLHLLLHTHALHNARGVAQLSLLIVPSRPLWWGGGGEVIWYSSARHVNECYPLWECV